MRRVLVVGGSGFLGSRVLAAASKHGLKVASVSRGGAPAWASSSSELAGVEWLRGDMSVEADAARAVEGCDAVVSCLGSFADFSYDGMRRENGAANVRIVEAAAAAGVRRFGYVSAEFIAPVDHPRLLGGYYAGKRDAESAVAAHFGSAGYIVRPPVVYGARRVGSVTLPLGAVFGPMAVAFSTPPVRALAGALGPLGSLLAPPVHVDDVALAAIAPLLDGGSEGGGGEGGGGGAGDGEPALVSGAAEIEAAAAGARALASSGSVTLFWDGACPLCQREISYYKSIDRAGAVNWVDCHADPSVLAPYGVTYEQAMARIHAAERTPEGGERLLSGVDAFMAVWRRLPYWSVLPPLLAAAPGALPAAEAAYKVWARARLRITGRALGEGTACKIDDPDACRRA